MLLFLHIDVWGVVIVKEWTGCCSKLETSKYVFIDNEHNISPSQNTLYWPLNVAVNKVVD